MRITIVLLCLFFTISISTIGQNYSFTPGSEVYGVLEMEIYTEHYLYIGHDSPDSAYITWRVVENTCPSGWDIQACDYQHCYTGLPNTGDMSAVAPGGEGYLRLIVNPYLIAGSGMLHFFIFPTGHQTEYVDAYFYFTTTAVDVNETSTNAQATLTLCGHELLYSGNEFGQLNVWSLTGERLKSVRVSPGLTHLPIQELAAGCYLIQTPQGKTQKIFIAH